LAFTMLLPTALAALYFVALTGPAQQVVYAAGKLVQFTFPLLFLVLCLRDRPRWRWPRPGGPALGVGFGLLVARAVLGAYFGAPRSPPLLAQPPGRIREKLEPSGLTSPAAYLACAAFYCVLHSLLEEYYWRWFVYGQLRTLLPPVAALALASLAFTAHHVIVL